MLTLHWRSLVVAWLLAGMAGAAVHDALTPRPTPVFSLPRTLIVDRIVERPQNHDDRPPLLTTEWFQVPACLDGHGRRALRVTLTALQREASLCTNEAGYVVEWLNARDGWQLLHPHVQLPAQIRFPDALYLQSNGQCEASYSYGSPASEGIRTGHGERESRWAAQHPGANPDLLACYSADDPARDVVASVAAVTDVDRRLVAGQARPR